MDRIVEYRINDEDCGKQIVKFLREKGFSRNILIGMKEDAGAILLNGERAGGRAALRTGDMLRIRVADPRPENRDSSPETRESSPEIRSASSESRNPSHAIRTLVIRNSSPEIKKHSLEIRIPSHAIENTFPEIKSSSPVIRIPSPEIREPSPETRSTSSEIKEPSLSIGTPSPAYRLPSPSILYEDQDLIILNKPAGTPVHPSAGNHGNTLADIMEKYFSAQNLYCPFRCINRLDRDTSGALILAKNPLSAAILSAQMKQRKIRRTYLAIVSGRTPEKGTIDAPIAREPGSALKRCVDFVNGETAVTHYERLAERDGFSLLEIHLETGRTHQIRVHMGYLGYPLPGDFLYCTDYTRFARQPLHSLQLEFAHPLTGEPLRFLAPVPRDMAETFNGFSRK